ncbi:MAG TPA: deoxynucleoside kinase [Chloroflexi bacterium]|nr:deoxynucleoside kinase [Chloroflexota bacterium]
MKRFIAIAGNIGVGKSTLTSLLEQRLGWEPFYEAVNDNPYLADFYQDMRRWAFHSQVFFLSRRLQNHRQILEHPASVIQDRSVYEDAEIFAANLYEQGAIDPRDYSVYRELYQAVSAVLPPPDLIVYLRAEVEILQKRIRQRGRDFERDISRDYLEQLNRLYDEWTARFTLCPVLTIPTDRLDFVANPDQLNQIATLILDTLQEANREPSSALAQNHPSVRS